MSQAQKMMLVIVGSIFGTTLLVQLISHGSLMPVPSPKQETRERINVDQTPVVTNPKTVMVDGQEYWVVLEVPSPQGFLMAQWLVLPDESRREAIISPPDYVAKDLVRAVTFYGLDAYDYTISWPMRLVIKQTATDEVMLNENYVSFVQGFGMKNIAFSHWFNDGEAVFEGGYADGPGFSDHFVAYDFGAKRIVSGLERSCYVPLDEKGESFGCEVVSVLPEISGILRDTVDGLRYFKNKDDLVGTIIATGPLDWNQPLATDFNVAESTKAFEMLVRGTPVLIRW